MAPDKQHPFEQVKYFLNHIDYLVLWLGSVSNLNPMCGGTIEYSANHLANAEALVSDTKTLLSRWYILKRINDDTGGNEEWVEVLNNELIRRSKVWWMK